VFKDYTQYRADIIRKGPVAIMRTKIASFVVLTMLFPGMAGAQSLESPKDSKDCSHVKLSLAPGVALWDKPCVTGLDFGLAVKTAKVKGLQSGVFYSEITEYGAGAQYSLIAVAKDFDGAQSGLIAMARHFRGYQYGVMNSAATFMGYQKGLVNMTAEMTGMQAGIVNIAQTATGLQCGVVNYTDSLKGLQLGIVNIISRSSLPFMILANASF
jgi:hypothetical protein